ncbi:hypothetical protein D3C84_788640 [compost metagenome]
MGIEVSVRQHQQLVEQFDAQIMHQAQRDPGQVVVPQERPQALPGSDQDDQQRHGHQQFQVLQVRHIGEKYRIGIAQAVDEILENSGQHGLGGREYHEAHDTQRKNAYVRPDVSQQP